MDFRCLIHTAEAALCDRAATYRRNGPGTPTEAESGCSGWTGASGASRELAFVGFQRREMSEGRCAG